MPHSAFMNKPDGAYIGLNATSKIGFYGKTTVVQPAHANQAALTGTAKAYTTTAGTANLKAGLTAAITLVERLRTDLVALGLIKGSA